MNTADIPVKQVQTSGGRVSTWRDWLGIVASVGCAIHCAAMPFVFAYLPAWGLSFLADESFHKWMALACFLIAIAAFVPGLRRHKNWWPVSIGAVGLACITFAAFGLAGECCPSCSSDTGVDSSGEISAETTSLVAEQKPSIGEQASPVGGETSLVSDECDQCEACESCEPSIPSEDSESIKTIPIPTEDQSSGNWLSILAPWITPFGGLLLVSAHLFNRRLGYLCSCCSPAVPVGAKA